MSDVRARSLRDLRQRFAAAAKKHLDLRCAIAQVTALVAEQDREVLLQKARVFGLGNQPNPWTYCWWQVKRGEYEYVDGRGEAEGLEPGVRIVKPAVVWYVQFCGKGAASSERKLGRPAAAAFLDLAKDAGRCLPSRDEPEYQLLPKEFQEGGASDANRWVFFLFHLAWTHPRGSPLAADAIFTPNGTMPDDGMPMVFSCALGMNAFLASVAAIDVLLDMLTRLPVHFSTVIDGASPDVLPAQSKSVNPAADSNHELNDREHEILLALLLLNAVGPRRAVSRRVAAKKADLSGNPVSYNRPIASLVAKKLVQSKPGPNGGIWLTPDGKRLAESTRPAK